MLRTKFLRTRVARRVLSLFMVGAVLPVLVMSALSFNAVSSQLREQSQRRLTDFSEIAAQAILGRLAVYQAVLGGMTQLVVTAEGGAEGVGESGEIELPPGILGIGVARDGRLTHAVGTAPDEGVFRLASEDLAHLQRGEAIVRVHRAAEGRPTTVSMLLAIDGPGTGLLWGSIVGDSVWAPAITLTRDAAVDDACVVDSTANPFFCAAGEESVLPGRVPPPAVGGDHAGRFDVQDAGGGGDHLVAWRAVYLRSTYRAPSWAVAVSQPGAEVYAPLDSFSYYLPLSVLIGVASVLLLSNVLVRRTMDPLERLTEGTQKLAHHDLSTRVDVTSADEFGDLATSFNAMAEQLGLQFRRLEAGRAIDHAVLTAGEPHAAVQAFLEGVGQVVPGGRMGVLMFEAEADGTSTLYQVAEAGARVAQSTHPIVAGNDTWLRESDLCFVATVAHEAAPPFSAWFDDCEDHVMILPVAVQGEPVGIVALTSLPGRGFTEDEKSHARHLVNQAAVALDEMKLRRELIQTGWEALRALANAIDAKSRWTAGHSERVTTLALAIGEQVGLTDKDRDVLHRGGLLHDIGKIGVPQSVLDSPGSLVPAARAVMNQHPAIGARILEPIRSLRPVLPIVLQHHERWDGRGYPSGLVGLDINPLARLLSVADVFDAMHSARPYRDAMGVQVVVDYIVSEAGAAFDPRMVEAFQAVMAAGFVPAEAGAPAPRGMFV